MNETVDILKNGITSLILKKEDDFKKSLSNSLKIKLNENITDLIIKTSKNIFNPKFKWTHFDENCEKFLNFLNEYDSAKCTKIKLKNESVINITESEIKSIKKLFNQLNPENRKIMIDSIFENNLNLEQHIEFYNKTKALEK
jgi:hypothetical protein